MQFRLKTIVPLAVLVMVPAAVCCAQRYPTTGQIAVRVPAEAVVFVNDARTWSTGPQRRYHSNLESGRQYRFRIRVELRRAGQLLDAKRTVVLGAGEIATLVFDEAAFSPRTTSRKEPTTLPQTEKASARISANNDGEVRNLATVDKDSAIASPIDSATLKRADRTPADRRPSLRSSIPHYSPPLVQEYLNKGQFAQAEEKLKVVLEQSPEDNELRFSLAATEFLHGVDELLNSFYSHGLQNETEFLLGQLEIPFLRLPVPKNPAPKPIDYERARAILTAFADRIQRAESTLASMDASEFQLALDLAAAGFDVDRNGQTDQSLLDVSKSISRDAQITLHDSKFVVFFDRSDAYWLQGYCHLLSAMVDVVLAHDGHELFNRSAHLFFPNAQVPLKFLRTRDDSFWTIIDTVAMIHSINLPVAEPKRMQRALEHLEASLALSRKMWASILAETDDLREWVPGPKQTSVFRNLNVTQPILDSWMRLLDEAEELLAGEKLLPFWRPLHENRGVNLRRVFTEPKPLDLVGWVQGVSAKPYLESGKMADLSVWRQLERVLGGQLVSFAVWVN